MFFARVRGAASPHSSSMNSSSRSVPIGYPESRIRVRRRRLERGILSAPQRPMILPRDERQRKGLR